MWAMTDDMSLCGEQAIHNLSKERKNKSLLWFRKVSSRRFVLKSFMVYQWDVAHLGIL